ncbi:MAG: hypothetical protein AB1Z98_37235 [Nannocystaceae bacterium]
MDSALPFASGLAPVFPGGAAGLSLLELAHPGPLPARLEAYAGLTLAALGRQAAAWIDGVLSLHPGATELDFLDFVIDRVDDPVVSSLARFERALSVARTARADGLPPVPARPGPRLQLHPAARTLELPGPAEQVIGAVALGLEVPPYAGWPVLVAPGLPTLWRKASVLEDALCTWLTRPRTTDAVRARFPAVARVLPRLIAARAIVAAD